MVQTCWSPEFPKACPEKGQQRAKSVLSKEGSFKICKCYGGWVGCTLKRRHRICQLRGHGWPLLGQRKGEINSAWGRLKKCFKEVLTFEMDHEASVGLCQAQKRARGISGKENNTREKQKPKLGDHLDRGLSSAASSWQNMSRVLFP